MWGQTWGDWEGLRVMKTVNRLTAAAVRSLDKPGMHPDGNSLYMLVAPSGSRSWIFRYTRDKRQHEMGLGSVAAFNLAEARERARKQRQLLADGGDPLAVKRATVAPKRVVTFEAAARQWLDTNRFPA